MELRLPIEEFRQDSFVLVLERLVRVEVRKKLLIHDKTSNKQRLSSGHTLSISTRTSTSTIWLRLGRAAFLVLVHGPGGRSLPHDFTKFFCGGCQISHSGVSDANGH